MDLSQFLRFSVIFSEWLLLRLDGGYRTGSGVNVVLIAIERRIRKITDTVVLFIRTSVQSSLFFTCGMLT